MVRRVTRLEVTLPGVASSVPPARHFAQRAVEAWGLDDASWATALIVTELAANAVLHARTEFTVTLVRLADAVRIEVRDSLAAPPRQRSHTAEATTGRGLRLVAELARSWGTDPAPGAAGKTIWCEVPVEVQLAAPAAGPGAVA